MALQGHCLYVWTCSLDSGVSGSCWGFLQYPALEKQPHTHTVKSVCWDQSLSQLIYYSIWMRRQICQLITVYDYTLSFFIVPHHELWQLELNNYGPFYGIPLKLNWYLRNLFIIVFCMYLYFIKNSYCLSVSTWCSAFMKAWMMNTGPSVWFFKSDMLIQILANSKFLFLLFVINRKLKHFWNFL